jgi:hypothetical protein
VSDLVAGLTRIFLDGKQVAAKQARRNVTYKEIEGTDGLLSTVYDVELCAVGIEYPLASGPATFTPEDLIEAVASQDDPAIQAPRVWLGHPDDDRFHAGRATPAGSAEPALGKVVNMRVEDQGMTLVGDVVGCPTWLAKILSSAYPNRSVEGFQDAQTVSGHKWGLVITDLALLGVCWPGVSTLADLEALYSADGPEVDIEEVVPMGVAASRSITAQVNIDDVRRAFYSALGDMDISSWSWIRAMQIDPNELIVDDDEGGLYRVPFDISGETVTFSDPQEVKIKYVNASQAKDPNARGLLVNYFTDGKKVAARWETRAESRPNNDPQEDRGMTPEMIQALRGRLGLTAEQLPDDASDEQVTAALTGEQPGPGQQPPPRDVPSPDQLPTTTDPNNPNAPAGPTSPQVAPPGATPPPATPPASPETPPAEVPEGYVAVPVAAWAQVQQNASAGARVAEQTENQRRDGIIAAAVKDGRISPAQKDSFKLMFSKDPQGAETLLTAEVDKGGLMKGTIPVSARGTDPSVVDVPEEAYPAGWLPELHQQGDGSRVTQEVAS